jgi:hypothetical protein
MFDSIIHDYRNLIVNQKTLLKKIIKIISIIWFYIFIMFITTSVFLWKHMNDVGSITRFPPSYAIAALIISITLGKIILSKIDENKSE